MKVGVLDVDNFRLGPIKRVPIPISIFPPNDVRHEVAPDDFVDAVKQLISDILPATSDCRGIVGGVLLSDEQGLPKSNYISWLDRRVTLPHPAGQGSFFDCFANSLGDEAQKQLGNDFRPGLPLPFLFWLRDKGQLSSRRCASQDWSRIVFAGGIAQ